MLVWELWSKKAALIIINNHLLSWLIFFTYYRLWINSIWACFNVKVEHKSFTATLYFRVKIRRRVKSCDLYITGGGPEVSLGALLSVWFVYIIILRYVRWTTSRCERPARSAVNNYQSQLIRYDKESRSRSPDPKGDQPWILMTARFLDTSLSNAKINLKFSCILF